MRLGDVLTAPSPSSMTDGDRAMMALMIDRLAARGPRLTSRPADFQTFIRSDPGPSSSCVDVDIPPNDGMSLQMEW